MPDTGPQTIHPPWCSPDHCTAPQRQPSIEQYRAREVPRDAYHRSERVSVPGILLGAGGAATLQVVESASTPWEVSAFVKLYSEDGKELVALDERAARSLVHALTGRLWEVWGSR